MRIHDLPLTLEVLNSRFVGVTSYEAIAMASSGF